VSNLLDFASSGLSNPVKATRTPASGACKCARHACWHQKTCRSNGVVRILRAPDPGSDSRTSVVLCRECAAPTRRNRVA
jgi:hypothetical protein